MDQRFNETIDHLDKCLMEHDQKSVEMKEDLHSVHQLEALSKQQARHEGRGDYREELNELEDESTVDRGERVTPSEDQRAKFDSTSTQTNRPTGKKSSIRF